MPRVCFCAKSCDYVGEDLAERCQENGCLKLVLVCHSGGTIWLQKHFCTGAAFTIARSTNVRQDTTVPKDPEADAKA